MKPLGLNRGGYRGETIDSSRVLGEILTGAAARGWSVENLDHSSLPLHALTRPVRNAARNIYLSAGLHGDEPAVLLAAQRLLRLDRWPADASLWFCPCLNPTGFPLNRRENAGGVDLNRDYLNPETEEIRAHVAWLERQPQFSVCIGLHEDWESLGFYLYELNPDGLPSPAEAALEEVARVCPIDPSPLIEGRPAQGGVIRPALNPATRPKWPEAFYLIQRQTRLSYTLEAPSDFPLAVRAEALVTAVHAILGRLPANATPPRDPDS